MTVPTNPRHSRAPRTARHWSTSTARAARSLPRCSSASAAYPDIARQGITSPQLTVREAGPEDYWACADVHCQAFYEREQGRRGSAAQPVTTASEVSSPWSLLIARLRQCLEIVAFISQRIDCVACYQGNTAIEKAGFGKTALLLASTDAETSQTTQQTKTDSSSDSSTSSLAPIHSPTLALSTSTPLATFTPATPATTATSRSNAPVQSDSSAIASVSHPSRSDDSPLSKLISLLEPNRVMGMLMSFAPSLVEQAARSGVGTSAKDMGLVGVATVDNFGDRVPQRVLTIEKDAALGLIRREGMGYICNVAVLPSARRQGVGRSLMREAEGLARVWGCRSVGLHCDPNNTAAIQMYESLGYRRTRFLEDPWIPWIMGRGPQGRCVFMIKRLQDPPSHSTATTPATEQPV